MERGSSGSGDALTYWVISGKGEFKAVLLILIERIGVKDLNVHEPFVEVVCIDYRDPGGKGGLHLLRCGVLATRNRCATIQAVVLDTLGIRYTFDNSCTRVSPVQLNLAEDLNVPFQDACSQT